MLAVECHGKGGVARTGQETLDGFNGIAYEGQAAVTAVVLKDGPPNKKVFSQDTLFIRRPFPPIPFAWGYYTQPEFDLSNVYA
jgi:hypothetical protein